MTLWFQSTVRGEMKKLHWAHEKSPASIWHVSYRCTCAIPPLPHYNYPNCFAYLVASAKQGDIVTTEGNFVLVF